MGRRKFNPGGRRECMLIPGVMYLYQKIRCSNDNASFFDVHEVFWEKARTCFGGRQLGCDNSNTHVLLLGNRRELSNHNNDYEQIGSRRQQRHYTSTSHTQVAWFFKAWRRLILHFLLNFVSCLTPLWFRGVCSRSSGEAVAFPTKRGSATPAYHNLFLKIWHFISTKHYCFSVILPPFQIFRGGL